MRVSVKVRSPRWRLPGGEVQGEVADAQQAALALEAAPQQGAQAGQQLGQREGLDQVVVGARRRAPAPGRRRRRAPSA